MILCVHRQRRSVRAFTLVEVLVTIMLIGMAMAVTAGWLSRAGEYATLKRVQADIAELDARARLLSMQGSDVRLEVAAGESREVMRVICNGEVVAHRAFAPTVTVEMRGSEGQHIDMVTIDRRGRSANYVVVLRFSDRNEQVHVLGVSGQVVSPGDDR